MGGLFGGGQTIKNSETPLSAFQIQSSAYGMAMGVLYGRNRITGNLIGYYDFTAVPHTTSSSQSGGKGGGEMTTESTTYTYTCSFLLGLGEGPVHSVNAYWVDKEYHDNTNVFTKFLGSSTQQPWGYLTSKHPAEALAYRGTAYVAAANYDLGSSSGLGNHNFDVTGRLPFQPGAIDGANPRDIIADIIANANYGVDPDADYVDSWLDFSNYCVANGIFLSPAYESQSEARQAISDIIQLTNSGIFHSEGTIKIVPYSDEAATGNGATFTPVTATAYDLTDDDFLDAEQPVRVLRTPNADAYNQVQIEFKDAANQYNAAIATAQDQASIELFGLRPMDKITAHGITDAETARFVAQLILQRVLYSRNTYEFKIGWRYARLEPCDYVTLTDTRLGLNRAPVRVLAVEESEDGELSITAEDAPAGILSSPLYDAPASGGYVVNFNVAPGDVAVPQFFEVPPTRSLSGLAIGVAVTGVTEDWGGAEIWVSNDGTSYANMGSIYGGARYGTIGSAITNAADQVARVTLSGKGGAMFSGSISDANALSTLCLVENEFAGHTTATLVSANVYDITLALRALYSTTAASHAGGSRFIRVDDAIAYSDALDLSMIGKTLSFKFLSFNRHGAAKQQLADVTAYSYTVTGLMAKLPPPALSGLAVTATANCNVVTWTNPAPDSMDRVEVWRSSTNMVGDATLAGTVRGAVGMFTDYLGAGGVMRYYWVRSINLQGFPSAYLGPESATTGTISVTLADGSVTTVKLATGAVTATKIEDGAISAPKMAANSVTAAAIAANAIVAEKIAADAITAAKIKAGEVQTSHLAAYAVTADKIDSRGLSIKDAAGNVILASGTSMRSRYVNTSLVDPVERWSLGGGCSFIDDSVNSDDGKVLYIPSGVNAVATTSGLMDLSQYGGRFVVSFKAWGSGSRTLFCDLIPDTLPENSVVVTTTPTVYSFVWNSAHADLKNCRMRLFAGSEAANIAVCNVRLHWVGSYANTVNIYNPVSSANISTYIAAAAIGEAQIANAAITTAKIGQAQIDTLRLAGNAVTVQQVATGVNSATINHTCSGGTVIVIAQASGSQFFGNEEGFYGTITLTISMDGTELTRAFGSAGDGGALRAFANFSLTPSAGSHSFTVSRSGDSGNASSCRIAILEAKR